MRGLVRRIQGAIPYGALLLIGVGSFWLYTRNAGFPVTFHSDESKKVYFALVGEDDFHHPILMLQMMRWFGALFGLATYEELLWLGRRLSALYTLTALGGSYLLFNRLLRRGWAVMATGVLATTPLLAVHAHYVKEDTLFLPAITFSLWALLRFVEDPKGRGRGIVLGICSGLALAAQYKALLFFGLAWFLPAFTPSIPTEAFRQGLRSSALWAISVFLIVCHPLLTEGMIFGSGFTEQVGHALSGHYIKIFAIPQWFTFHLRRSLLPGMTLPLLLVCLAGGISLIRSWPALRDPWRIIILFSVVFYLSAEFSPSKPAPGYIRYMIPLVPVLILIGFGMIQDAWRGRERRGTTTLRITVATLVGLSSLWESSRLVDHLEEDTRYQAESEMAAISQEFPGARFLVEGYAGGDTARVNSREMPTVVEMVEAGYTHVVVSNFASDRYLAGVTKAYQRPEVYRLGETYRRLYAMEHVEIQPAFKPFAYSNPVIRVITLPAGPLSP